MHGVGSAGVGSADLVVHGVGSAGVCGAVLVVQEWVAQSW